MPKILIIHTVLILILNPISLFAGDFILEDSVVTDSNDAADRSEPTVDEHANQNIDDFNNSLVGRVVNNFAETLASPSSSQNDGGFATLSCGSENVIGHQQVVLKKDCSGQNQVDCGHNFTAEIEQKYGSASKACQVLGDSDHNDAGGSVYY
jgi:hypothetical protein